MGEPKLCQQFLRAAAMRIRQYGMAQGTRIDPATGQVCMLGAMDHCGVDVPLKERLRIEKHVASLLPSIPAGASDPYNGRVDLCNHAAHIAWWNNTVAEGTEEVAQKLEEAAESC